jgi:hypothetical protein
MPDVEEKPELILYATCNCEKCLPMDLSPEDALAFDIPEIRVPRNGNPATISQNIKLPDGMTFNVQIHVVKPAEDAK